MRRSTLAGRTNNGGSWVGRLSSFKHEALYWFGAWSHIQFGYRRAKVAKGLIPRGATTNDGSMKFNWCLLEDLSVSASVQYAQWVDADFGNRLHK